MTSTDLQLYQANKKLESHERRERKSGLLLKSLLVINCQKINFIQCVSAQKIIYDLICLWTHKVAGFPQVMAHVHYWDLLTYEATFYGY